MVESVTITRTRPGEASESVTLSSETFHQDGIWVSVPSENQFVDRDFLPADDLEVLASDLINRHTTFSHFPSLTIHYRWKKKGGKKSGAAIYGKCVKPSGLLAAYSDADFVIWLAADYVRDAQFTQRQIEALLFHEMLHAGVSDIGDDDEGEPKSTLIPHDVEMFRAEIISYGFWSDELKSLEMSVRQLNLFDEDDDRELD